MSRFPMKGCWVEVVGHAALFDTAEVTVSPMMSRLFLLVDIDYKQEFDFNDSVFVLTLLSDKGQVMPAMYADEVDVHTWTAGKHKERLDIRSVYGLLGTLLVIDPPAEVDDE